MHLIETERAGEFKNKNLDNIDVQNAYVEEDEVNEENIGTFENICNTHCKLEKIVKILIISFCLPIDDPMPGKFSQKFYLIS